MDYSSVCSCLCRHRECLWKSLSSVNLNGNLCKLQTLCKFTCTYVRSPWGWNWRRSSSSRKIGTSSKLAAPSITMPSLSGWVKSSRSSQKGWTTDTLRWWWNSRQMLGERCGSPVYLVLFSATVNGDMARQENGVWAGWGAKVPRLDSLDGRRQAAPGKTSVCKIAEEWIQPTCTVEACCVVFRILVKELFREGEVCKQVFKKKVNEWRGVNGIWINPSGKCQYFTFSLYINWPH